MFYVGILEVGTHNARAKSYFRLILGSNIYYMGDRPTIMRYPIKFGEESHQKDLRISLIA